jgi:hypothetical protein
MHSDMKPYMSMLTLTQSHEVWDLWAKWELEVLEELSSSTGNNQKKKAEKEEAVMRIDEMFLARLRQPHSSESNPRAWLVVTKAHSRL